MSQLQVNRINDASGGVLAPISSVMRNRIINGQMTIDQRNAGASVTPSADGYTLDRWIYQASQTSKFTIQQNAGSVTPPVGFGNYLGTSVASAVTIGSSDYFLISQYIEGFNTSDLGWGTANAKTITLSFWVRSSLTGTFGGALQNNATNRSYPFTYTILSANTWEQKSVTIAGDTTGTWVGATNGLGVRVRFGLGVGSTLSGTAGAWNGNNNLSSTGAVNVVGTSGATFYITGVQLEVGTQATSFEYRQYQQELALCQRYYQKLLGNSNDNNWFNGVAFTTTTGISAYLFTQQMRASATLAFGGNFEAVGGGTINSATLNGSDTTPFSAQIGITTTGLTAGGGCLVRTGTGNSSVEISAEL